jgi:hypothetical protein
VLRLGRELGGRIIAMMQRGRGRGERKTLTWLSRRRVKAEMQRGMGAIWKARWGRRQKAT